MIATVLGIASEEQQGGGGHCGSVSWLFIIERYGDFGHKPKSFSLFFLMVGIELRTPHSVKILYSLASKCCSPLTGTVGHGLQHEVT